MPPADIGKKEFSSSGSSPAARPRAMKRKIIGSLAVALGVLVLVVWSRPDSFHVERSVVVAAPAEVAFAQVNDFRAWRAWSPYEELDPNMQRDYGPATYAWRGDGKVGAGKMTRETSESPSRIAIRLDFEKPMKATNVATFSFAPTGDGRTKVTWAMDGQQCFVGKAASLFFDMDKMVGGDFEKGLASLKRVVEDNKDALTTN